MIIRTYNTFELESDKGDIYMFKISLIGRKNSPSYWQYDLIIRSEYEKILSTEFPVKSIRPYKYLTIEEAIRQLDFPSKLRYKNHRNWIA